MAYSAGPDEWRRYEDRLADGSMSLRAVLGAHAGLVRASFEAVDALLAQRTRFDPAFAPFAHRCATQRIPVVVLSSGIGELIRRAMVRHGLESLDVRANEADPSPDGWVMRFADESDNGHDKALAVRSFQAQGARVAYVGDGYSDFDAALVADVRFARTGRSLERYLMEKGVEFTPFSSFAEVERALF
ncbi:MAG TPA: haloacid dehalogenase-like hydrolase [Verrucomicrobiae bacterium]|nr:haloacid dehalogenase-like hydrolase [Verrucomicrobiae bacterium]